MVWQTWQDFLRATGPRAGATTLAIFGACAAAGLLLSPSPPLPLLFLSLLLLLLFLFPFFFSFLPCSCCWCSSSSSSPSSPLLNAVYLGLGFWVQNAGLGFGW